MGRPTTKAGLMVAATDNFKKLNTLISGLTEKELSTAFDFQMMKKRKRHIGNGIKISGIS